MEQLLAGWAGTAGRQRAQTRFGDAFLGRFTRLAADHQPPQPSTAPTASILLDMATQDEGGIPFSISQEQQQFRLLELPPALLDLIASPNPPV